MNVLKTLLFFSALCTMTTSVYAVKIYECEDEQGNRTFQKRCPPGTTPLNERQYSTKTNTPQTRSLGRVTLYLVPNCDTCDQVKEFLSVRNISVNEKNVNENVQLQEELKEKTGGDLRVPVVLIGNEVLTGYNRSALISAIENAGYGRPQAEEEKEEEETGFDEEIE